MEGKGLSKLKQTLKLFGQFFIFGCFTFGGGWSIIAQMQKKYVEKEKSITSEELLDMTSVGRSLPGTMVGNVAMLYGYRVAGLPGGIACLLGMVIPPFIILSVVTYFYNIFRTNPYVISAMTGVRAAIVPVILSAALGLLKGAFKFPPCYVVAALTFALYLFFNVSCVLLIILGVVCGLAICEYYERRPGGNGHNAA